MPKQSMLFRLNLQNFGKKSFDDRKGDEGKEGYEEKKTGLPEERFQGTKQVLSPDELGVSKSSIAGTDGAPTGDNPKAAAAKALKSKIKIRPDVSVEELNGKQVGGVPLAGSLSLRSVAGVSGQSAADDTSKIPYSGGNYRPGTRYGKKRSEDLFLLDNTISEQIAPQVDESKDLRESPDSKQGYNGRKQFTQTRAKKNYSYTNGSGHVVGKKPQQLLNDVSVDFTGTAKRIYTTGQIIGGGSGGSGVIIDGQADYPDQIDSGTATQFVMHKGNYQPKKLVIKTANGMISGIEIVEDYFQIHTDPLARDQSNFNWQIDANNVAKTMVKIQKELGRETTDKWSPLAYVVNKPFEYNMLMHDIEATTGAIMAIAYRAAVSSMAFQRNITAKDGINPQLNAVKMILEGYAGVLKNNTTTVLTDSQFDHMIWRSSAYRAGSVAGLIAMFDTTGKYRTKADILGLQRSLSLHLSQCDNNLNPLHCKPEFMQVLNKAHCFSTVEGTYNPMLPIHATRKLKVVNPLSLNAFLIGWLNPHDKANWDASELANPLRDQETGTLSNYAYAYKDIRNTYKTRVQHPLIEGLVRWLLKHEGAFVKTFGNGVTVNIPFEFNFQNPSLLEFILCSASQDVVWERNITMRDVLFVGDQSEYIWNDLVGLDKLNPLHSTQLTIQKYDEPLKMGKLAPDVLVREMWNEHMQKTVHGSGKVQYFLPWYMNEAAFGSTAGGSYTQNEGFLVEEKAFNMSIPSIRDGVRHEYVDVIKSMSERDIRLALDRMTTIPTFVNKTTQQVTLTVNGSSVTKDLWVKYDNYNSSTDLNNYIKLSTIRYDANSDGRMIAVYDLTSNSNRELPHQALYLVPRELGWICDDLDGETIITKAEFKTVSNVEDLYLTTTALSPEVKLGAGNSAYAYNGYSPFTLTSYRVSADSATDGSIDRSAALTQVFYNCFACVDADSINKEYVAATGIVPCLSYNDGNAEDIYGVYNLGSDNESSSAIDKTIRSNAARIWTLVQRFFLPVNRFENSFTMNSANVDYDPFEASFYFGVCGFLASDYTQDILERLDVYDQLGLDYTEDVFVKASSLFRLD